MDALPGDTITFAINGTILLTEGELIINKSLMQNPEKAGIILNVFGRRRSDRYDRRTD
jgi:hypothetical protein